MSHLIPAYLGTIIINLKIFIDKISLLGPDHLIVVAGALPVSPYGFDGLAVPCRASRICPHFGWATWRVRPAIREFPSPIESVAAFETRLRIVVWRFEGVPGWVGLCGLLTGWPPHTNCFDVPTMIGPWPYTAFKSP